MSLNPTYSRDVFGTDLVTAEPIDDNLDAQQCIVLVLDLEEAESSRHQG